jgi:chromosome segregation ATPase
MPAKHCFPLYSLEWLYNVYWWIGVAELDKAKQEIDEERHRRTSLEHEASRMEMMTRRQSELEAGRDHHEGSVYLELDNAKKDISTLQATLSDAWSHHGACALELARAKEEITWLEADLEAAQSLAVELAHAKDDINVLQEDLKAARGLQSIGLLKAKEEISRLRSQHEASSSELATAINDNTTLQADLDALRGLHEASTAELQNATQEISNLRAAYETAISESANAEEEIRRLQSELAASGRDSSTALRDTEEKMENLQSHFDFLRDQFDTTCTELSEATRQTEKLRGEFEELRVKYESCSSELFTAKEDVFRLEVEQLASHESLMTDIRIAQDENSKLQVEVAALQAEKNSLSVALAKAREELETAGKRHDRELLTAGNDVARLQGELSALQGQHKDCFRELELLRNVSVNFQTELSHIQELHEIVMAELLNAREEVANLQVISTEEFESSLEVVRDLKGGIGELQADLSMQYTTLIVEKSLLEKKTKDLALELTATTTRLQEASAAQEKAEAELAAIMTEETPPVMSALRAELEEAQAELVKARESETKLERMTLEVEELRAQMAFRNHTMTAELTADMDALRSDLDAVRKAEAKYRDLANTSQAQIEDLKEHLYGSRDAEAKANEKLVSITSELQQKKIELEMAKEALEWVGGDAAALSAEVAALKSEVTSKSEGEAKAKAAFTDYSLKLQKTRLELEDVTKLADKVPIMKAPPVNTQVAQSAELYMCHNFRFPLEHEHVGNWNSRKISPFLSLFCQARTFKLDLDDATARLEKAVEAERTMSASMASLKAELNNARTELAATREDHGLALAEKEQRCELELNQMRAQWEVAVISEATLTDANFALNESLLKVTGLLKLIVAAVALYMYFH